MTKMSYYEELSSREAVYCPNCAQPMAMKDWHDLRRYLTSDKRNLEVAWSAAEFMETLADPQHADSQIPLWLVKAIKKLEESFTVEIP